jgi:two-component system NtrC family sensor kinase
MTAVIPLRDQATRNAACPRILVIDDNVLLARSFARILRTYDTIVEHDPGCAVTRITAGERFDVILCDLQMPKMSGLEVLAAIRAHYAGRLGMPRVVMMSGGDPLREGDPGTPVLTKPCSATEVRALVARLIESDQ